MLDRINQRLERWLIKGGFPKPDVRIVVRNQIYVSLGTSLVIMLVTLLSRWSLAYSAGAIIALVNFWTLARVTQTLVYDEKRGPFLLFIIFMAKMTLSGLALWWLIGVERVPHWGLICGLGTVVVNITGTGLQQLGKK
ncbi:ATP synthase subunit I [uncultured Pseudodesulfovibrio sp.]|uniref:ATP synthase subunit I n=1 Tax=uncultured Pseudodesulfovibrio sp. TaxID=2035858 RepID=UPI0029C7B34F|nr:ATP synthase subunit I [uncultured Pseudodesulfovibrio sp.]